MSEHIKTGPYYTFYTLLNSLILENVLMNNDHSELKSCERRSKFNPYNDTNCNSGCVFPMIIWPAFRMRQYRVNDHRYHAPQFISP